MMSTNAVLDLLREANPDRVINEGLLRRAIRSRRISRPSLVAGRYLWTRPDIEALATAIGLKASTVPSDPGPLNLSTHKEEPPLDAASFTVEGQ